MKLFAEDGHHAQPFCSRGGPLVSLKEAVGYHVTTEARRTRRREEGGEPRKTRKTRKKGTERYVFDSSPPLFSCLRGSHSVSFAVPIPLSSPCPPCLRGDTPFSKLNIVEPRASDQNSQPGRLVGSLLQSPAGYHRTVEFPTGILPAKRHLNPNLRKNQCDHEFRKRSGPAFSENEKPFTPLPTENPHPKRPCSPRPLPRARPTACA